MHTRVSKFPEILVPVPNPKFNYFRGFSPPNSPNFWLSLSPKSPQNPLMGFPNPHPRSSTNFVESPQKSPKSNPPIFPVPELQRNLNNFGDSPKFPNILNSDRKSGHACVPSPPIKIFNFEKIPGKY